MNVWAEIQLEESDQKEESIGDLGCHSAIHNVVRDNSTAIGLSIGNKLLIVV